MIPIRKTDPHGVSLKLNYKLLACCKEFDNAKLF